MKAERREPSGENRAILPTFQHLPECLRTSAYMDSSSFTKPTNANQITDLFSQSTRFGIACDVLFYATFGTIG